jgi:signal peptidase I
MIHILITMIGSLIGLLIGVGLLLRFTIINYLIENCSMEPTYYPGERVLTLRCFPAGWICKGQVVVVNLRPILEHQGLKQSTAVRPYIKRVIGKPGDRIRIQPTKLDLNIRDQVVRLADPQEANEDWIIVPARHLFICGDNRLNSYDSYSFGPIPYRNLIGVVICKWGSPKQTLVKDHCSEHASLESAKVRGKRCA